MSENAIEALVIDLEKYLGFAENNSVFAQFDLFFGASTMMLQYDTSTCTEKMIAMDGEKNDKTGIKIFITLLGREHSEASEMGSFGDSRAKTFTRNIIVRHTGILSFANKETLNGQLKLIGEGNLANLRSDLFFDRPVTPPRVV